VSLANREKLRRAQALEPKAAAKLRKSETDQALKSDAVNAGTSRCFLSYVLA